MYKSKNVTVGIYGKNDLSFFPFPFEKNVVIWCYQYMKLRKFLMTKEKFSWLVAVLCCLYFLYSLLLTILSTDFPSIQFVLALLSSIIAFALFKNFSIGIKLSIIFSILIIVFIGILLIFNNTEFNMLMCVAIIPSCIISIYIKNRVCEFSNEKLNSSRSLGKSIGTKILSIIYFVSILSLVLAVFFIDQNTYTPYLFNTNLFLVVLYGVMFFIGNEIARKIAVVFPFVLLYYNIIYISLLWDGLSVGFLGDLVPMMFSIYGFAIFIILFLLSLPHYKWKKKVKVIETVTDKVTKDDVDND